MGKREDILDAALGIVSEGGIRALTLPVLFEHASTGAGTFYHYYRDREDLLESVFAHCFDVATRELADADEKGAPTRVRFDGLCSRLFSAYVRYPREFDFLYWYSFGYVQPDVTLCRVIPSVMLLTSIIAAAQKGGLIGDTSSASVLARVVRGMAASVFWGYQRGACVMDDDAARRFAEGAWRAISCL